MKRYLVTGARGWLAGELERRLAAFPEDYELKKTSVRGEGWDNESWSNYDGVFHFASVIYENDTEGINPAITSSVAGKCVADGVPWMLFMSSFSVYGSERRPDVVVDETTMPKPVTQYGRSKLASEEAAHAALYGSLTKLAIVRAPLIYGPGQRRGSFPALMGLARKVPLFPSTKNMRSMIFSQNLCELCRLLADAGAEGLFLPQDGTYYDTAELVRGLAERQGNKVRILPGTAGVAHATCRLSPKLGKLFGNARYRMVEGETERRYRIVNVDRALDITVESTAL